MKRKRTATKDCRQISNRRMSFDALEHRLMLATVTTLTDVVDPNDGELSLREAVRNAVPEEVIDFAVAGTIELSDSLGEIAIDKSLTIDGGNQITIDALDQGFRIFNIDDGIDNDDNWIELNGLTLTGGGDESLPGGAIFTAENLRVRSSVITGNRAERGGGISTSGNFDEDSYLFGTYDYVDVYIYDSLIDDNLATTRGGGVYSGFGDGSLQLNDTHVTGNQADAGSALYAFVSPVRLVDSYITGNANASSAVEGLYSRIIIAGSSIVGNDGAGVLAGSVSLYDSTVSRNRHGVVLNGRFVGTTTIDNSVISDNLRTGLNGDAFHITNSVVSGNSTGLVSHYSRAQTQVFDSVFENNRLGAIKGYYGQTMRLYNSTVDGNTSTRGAIDMTYGNVELHNSTVSNNAGGGIYALRVSLNNSTVSGNSSGSGGGISVEYDDSARLHLYNSTVTNNSAGRAGGIDVRWSGATVTIKDSIVAGNHANSESDLRAHPDVTIESEYSLFEQTGLNLSGIGNIVGESPGLLPLTFNGGPTQTHALAPGSPAINMGNPAPDMPPDFDQRGEGFARVVQGRIDIGAFELQEQTDVDGDFNDDGSYDCLDINLLTESLGTGTNDLQFDLTGDGVLGLADIDAWLIKAGQINLGAGGRFLHGDANLDGVVDTLDFNQWNRHKFSATTEWCSGNFNGDVNVDVSDFNIWSSNKFTSGLPLMFAPVDQQQGSSTMTPDGSSRAVPFFTRPLPRYRLTNLTTTDDDNRGEKQTDWNDFFEFE